MDRRAEPDCLRERGSSPGPSRDFAPTQVRRRTAPTKRRWRSNSVPLGGAQRPGGSLSRDCFVCASIRVQLITQITQDKGAGCRLTRIVPKNCVFKDIFFGSNTVALEIVGLGLTISRHGSHF